MCVQRLVLAVGLWVFTTKQHDSSHIQSTHTHTHTHTHTQLWEPSSPFPFCEFSAFYKSVTWQICLLFLFNELPEQSPNTAFLPDTPVLLLIWTSKVRLPNRPRTLPKNKLISNTPTQMCTDRVLEGERKDMGWIRGDGSRTGTLCQLKWWRMTRGASCLTAAVNRGPG